MGSKHINTEAWTSTLMLHRLLDFPKGNVLCEAKHTEVLTNFCSKCVNHLFWLGGVDWPSLLRRLLFRRLLLRWSLLKWSPHVLILGGVNQWSLLRWLLFRRSLLRQSLLRWSLLRQSLLRQSLLRWSPHVLIQGGVNQQSLLRQSPHVLILGGGGLSELHSFKLSLKQFKYTNKFFLRHKTSN